MIIKTKSDNFNSLGGGNRLTKYFKEKWLLESIPRLQQPFYH